MEFERKNLVGRIEQLRSTMERVTPIMKHAPSKRNAKDTMSGQVAMMDELERKLVSRVAILEELRQKIDLFISTLPTQQATVIRLRYVCGLSWKSVSRRTSYSESHLFYIDRAAKRKLE